MAARDTCIIGLGKPIQVLTQAHHTEELMRDEFPLPSRAGKPLPMMLVDRDGEIRCDLREWQFHHVPMFSARAAQVTQQLVAAARRGVTLYHPI